MLKSIKISILITIIICVVILYFLNTKLDQIYLVNFVTNLLTNIIVLWFWIFFVDNIIESEKHSKYMSINKFKSEWISFFINRLQLKLLVFLDIIDNQETYMSNDIQLNNIPIIFANNLENICFLFFKKINSADDKSWIINTFNNIRKEESENILLQLKQIYPQPKAEIIHIFEADLPHLLWWIEVINLVLSIESEISKEKIELKLTDNQKATLLKITYIIISPKISEICEKLSKASILAKNNKLFEYL